MQLNCQQVQSHGPHVHLLGVEPPQLPLVGGFPRVLGLVLPRHGRPDVEVATVWQKSVRIAKTVQDAGHGVQGTGQTRLPCLQGHHPEGERQKETSLKKKKKKKKNKKNLC